MKDLDYCKQIQEAFGITDSLNGSSDHEACDNAYDAIIGETLEAGGDLAKYLYHSSSRFYVVLNRLASHLAPYKVTGEAKITPGLVYAAVLSLLLEKPASAEPQTKSSGLQLEVGKSYLNKRGDAVAVQRIVENHSHPACRYEAFDAQGIRYTFTEEGHYYPNLSSKFDLIEEVKE